MKRILILGAGRSSSSLIQYLLSESKAHNWQIRIADFSLHLAQEKTAGHSNASAISFNVDDHDQRLREIQHADVVISLLPAHLHPLVGETCALANKPMITASYVSPEIRKIKSNALMLMECGLDPGLDHMSSMKAIAAIASKGGKMLSYKSYTGGLIAPESDNNPWHYKITWNPRNVVTAGQGTAVYLENQTIKRIPYHKLFSRFDTIQIDDHGIFEGYPNRDSLAYAELYNLNHIPTLIRGTLRKPGFCQAWDVFVQLGLTSEAYQIEESEHLSYREWIDSYLPAGKIEDLESRLCQYLKLDIQSPIMKKLSWLGLFSNEKTGLKQATPAQILQKILEDKWKLSPEDKDMIVMKHEFIYEFNGKKKCLESSLVIKGDDQTYTAMAKTVGLPLGIAAKLILENKIQLKGLQIPTHTEIYAPILSELKNHGIQFREKAFDL
jgi:saccharopine dehydrogenase-like NADP-dependent oxidoreductase